MKVEVKGNRFSRHADVVPESGAGMVALLTTGGISESVRVAMGMAVEILKSRGLPHAALLFWDEAEQTWKGEVAQADGRARKRYLWQHLKATGFSRDSVEGLCGAVIEAAFHWERSDRDTIREDQAFRIGLFYGLLRAYATEAYGNQSNAKADRRKRWAVEFAEELVRENPGVGFAQLWDLIPDDDSDQGEEVPLIYRDGDDLCYFPDSRPKEGMSRGTFQKNYVRRVQRNSKN
jgi:hypothetical protein